jgi:chromate transporter
MEGQTGTENAAGEKLTLGALFSGFFQAGILGFGGVLPVARRMLVEQRKWLSEAEFNDLFSFCQFMPGANIVNLTFVLGARHRGWTGAAAALCGLFAAPVAIVLCAAGLYTRYGSIPTVQHGLTGLAAAGAGLVMGTAMKIAAPILKHWRPFSIAGATFYLVVLLHLSLPLTMGLLLPLSVALAWRA